MLFDVFAFALMLEGPDWYNSPVMIPIAGCIMMGSIAVAGIWSGVRTREMRSQERLAMIAQGLQPEPDWEQETLRQAKERPASASGVPARPSDGAKARRAGIILCSIGLGLIGFFFLLALSVHTPEVLAGAAAGILPLAIGIGFLADARMRRRDYDRWMDTVYPRMAAYPPAYSSEMPMSPPPPPPSAPAGMSAAQASDWRPLH